MLDNILNFIFYNYNSVEISCLMIFRYNLPHKSYIFLLIGTGIVLVLSYIYPIVPYVPAFLDRFILIVTVAKSMGLEGHLYFYSLVLELFLGYSISYQKYLTQ